MPSQNRITLKLIYDELVSFKENTKTRFDNVDDQFKKVDDQFRRVDDQFKKVDDQFKKVDDQFKSIDNQFKSIDNRFKSVATEIFRIEDKFVLEIKKLYERLSNIERNLEKLTGDMEVLSQEYHLIVEGLKRLEGNKPESRTDLLAKNVKGLQDRVDRLEERVFGEVAETEV